MSQAPATTTDARPPIGPVDTARAALRLSPSGRWLLASGATWTLVGLLFGLPVATALGVLPLLTLTWAFGVARIIRNRLGNGALHVSFSDADPRIPIGRTLSIDVDVRLARGLELADLTLIPVCRAPLAVDVTQTYTGSEVSRTLRIAPQRVGDWWVHGVRARAQVVGRLFALEVWVAAPLRVVAVPRHFPQRTSMRLSATRSSLQEHSGLPNRKRRGLGLELRELRDHQPGDPFKHIAWRASARRGKLISREFESELVLSAWILVDCSPSMFWGQPGRARVDYAIETAYNLASILLSGRDRAGVMAFDDRVRLRAAPSAKRGQLGRILDVLLEVPHLIHEERTELTERELTDHVARWFRAQRGQSFALPHGLVQAGSPRLSAYDEGRLIDHAQEVLQQVSMDRRRGPLLPFDGYAADYQRSLLRAFCRHMGIVLPLDPTPRPHAQARGLEAAMHAVMTSRGGPHSVIVISDLYTADDLDALRRIAVAARRRRHSLIVFCPNAPGFDAGSWGDSPITGLASAIVETERLRVRQNLAAAQAVLRPAGTTFLSVGPDDALARVLARLRLVA